MKSTLGIATSLIRTIQFLARNFRATHTHGGHVHRNEIFTAAMLLYYQHQWEGALGIYSTDPFSILLAPSMTSSKMAIRMTPNKKSAENHNLPQQHGHQALSRQGPIILHLQCIPSDARTQTSHANLSFPPTVIASASRVTSSGR